MDVGEGGGSIGGWWNRIGVGRVLGGNNGGRQRRSSSILVVMVSCCWVSRMRASSSLSEDPEDGLESSMAMKAPKLIGVGLVY